MRHLGELAQEWLSAHLHFAGEVYGNEADCVISAVVEPFVQRARARAWINRYFFIRFNHGGAHIRLRLRGTQRILDSEVRPALLNHLRELSLHVGASRGMITDVRWLKYSPEIDRYGGSAAINIAEECFEASSQLAMTIIRKLVANGHALRLGKALLATLVLIHSFYPDIRGSLHFAQLYRTNNLSGFARDEADSVRWRQAFQRGFEQQADTLYDIIVDVWERLTAGEPLLPEFDRFRADLVTVRDNLERLSSVGRVRVHGVVASSTEEALSWIVPSYVHMMNNRLGVSIPEEAYLAHLIVRSLNEKTNLEKIKIS